MTAVDDLAAIQTSNGKVDPISAAEQLAALLDLPTVGLSIRGARVVGRGSRASADLYISDGTEINFESIRDIANPTRLVTEIAICTGASPSLKAPQAIRAVALLQALAEHQIGRTEDEIARDWGTSYLQATEVIDVDMSDQLERWGAFEMLKKRAVILRHVDGTRFVRCSVYRDEIRLRDGNVTAHALAHRMERIGWQRPGNEGRVKATRPELPGSLVWAFYTVPAGWED